MELESRRGICFHQKRHGGTEQSKLLASDAASNDFFGYGVAISDDTAIIGAYAEDTAPNSNNGAAYVFVRSGKTWTEQAKLVASDAESFDQFGFDVAISGDTAVIAARWQGTGLDTNQDAAYLFVRTGAMWTQIAKLSDSDGTSFDQLQRRYFRR